MRLPISKNLQLTTFLLIILIGPIASMGLSLQYFTRISSSGSIDYEPTEKILFEDGFESGNLNAWTGVGTSAGDSAAVAQIKAYEDNYHAHFYTDGTVSGTETALCYYTLSPERNEIYARGYYYISSGLPLDDDDERFGLLTIRDTTSGWMTVNFRIQRVQGVEKFSLIMTSGTAIWATATTDAFYPQLNTWYCFELYFKVHVSEGESRVWINGVESLTITGKNTANYGNIDQVRFGLVSTNVQQPVDVYVDACVISSQYIGPCGSAVSIMFEDGFESGDSSDWSGGYTTTDDNATVVATEPYEGGYHGRFQTGTIVSGLEYAYFYKDLSPELSEVYVRGYFHIVDGLPLDNDGDRFGLIGFEVEGALTATFRVYRSGGVDRFSIVGIDGDGAFQKDTDAIYPAKGQWYSLEFYIKVHSTLGEYRAWINGVEQITITNLNTTRYGTGVDRVRFGLTFTADVQHYVEVFGDCAVISTCYIGPLQDTFGVICPVASIPAIRNFYCLFGNQSIRYQALLPSEITNFADIDRFGGLVVWTEAGYSYNATAIRHFARTRVVISHVWDFCNIFYPSLSGSTQVVATNTVTYVRDWGNFRSNDLAEMRNETGNTNQLTTVLASALTSFSNVSQLARYDANRIAFFHMKGETTESGFFVMDLHATTAETEWTGIWHLFPAIKMVRYFPTGKYARWMANGQSWWDLTWVYNRIDTMVTENSDVAEKWIIGQSVEGRDILAIVIGKGSRYAIIDGSIHGNEKTGTFACLRIAELLIEYYRSDPYWKNRLTEFKVIIVPVLNPDGFVLNNRENANDVDLNRQFPPEGSPNQPEAWTLIWLMGNYTPIIYINIHEGWHYYPLDILYGNYEEYQNRTLTIEAMEQANNTFTDLRHWGWFTEQGSNVWIGKVRQFWKGGINSMAIAYASWKHDASCMLLETFLWSQVWGARKCLWGIDYYCAVIIAFLQHINR